MIGVHASIIKTQLTHEYRLFLRTTGDRKSPIYPSNIPSLDELRAFEATARQGSVRLAADSLALTHGAVCRRITKLANDIGVKLFKKSGRGLRLTPAGGRDNYDHHSLMVVAASAGLGIAFSPLVLAVDDVEQGRLAAPAGFDPDGSQYGLIWLGSSELQGVEFELAEWLER